jgi:hypothetical protein
MKEARLQCFVMILFLVVAVSPSTAKAAELTVSMLKNAQYSPVGWGTQDQLEKKKIKLVAGEYMKQGPEGPMDVESLTVVKIALGDLNGDGKKDGAVILYHNTGGSGSVAQVAAVIDDKGKPRHVASRNLGDRTEIIGLTIEKGFIVIELDNPRFYPGQKKTVKYQLVGNKLEGPKPFK